MNMKMIVKLLIPVMCMAVASPALAGTLKVASTSVTALTRH